MNIRTNLKEIFYNELKKSNITVKEFCVRKNIIHYDKVFKIFKKKFWHKELNSDEELVVQVFENWLNEKQNERASRQIFDVKELQLKF